MKTNLVRVALACAALAFTGTALLEMTTTASAAADDVTIVTAPPGKIKGANGGGIGAGALNTKIVGPTTHPDTHAGRGHNDAFSGNGHLALGLKVIRGQHTESVSASPKTIHVGDGHH